MRWRDGVLLAAVSIAAVTSVLTFVEVRMAQDSIRGLAPENGALTAPLERQMQTMKTTWKDEKGVEHSVTTTRGDNEPLDEFTARHEAAVAALQAIYPPA